MLTVTYALAMLCLVLAALEDAWRYRISNMLSLALILLFVVAAIVQPIGVDWLDHLSGALFMFALGTAMFGLGWMGGGDVKLLTAVALWCGLADLPRLLITTSLLGGALVIALIVVRRALPAAAGEWRPKILRRNAPVPYGIAISVGALLLLAPQLTPEMEWRSPVTSPAASSEPGTEARPSAAAVRPPALRPDAQRPRRASI